MDEVGLQASLDAFLRIYFSVFEPAPKVETLVFRAEAGLVQGIAATARKLEDFTGDSFAAALRAALLDNDLIGIPQHYEYFFPDFFQNFLIQRCLELPESAGRRFYALPRVQDRERLFLPLFSLEESWLKKAGEFFLPSVEALRSFLDRELRHKNAHLDAYQAQRLHAQTAAEFLARISGHPDTFACLNTIASLKYEKHACSASIAFSDTGVIPLKAAFNQPLSLLQYRKARKLLAAMDSRLCLAASGDRFLGIARVEDINRPGVYLASLIKHLSWELSCQGRLLLRCEEGRLSAGRRQMQDTELAAFAQRVLGLDETGASRVLYLIKGAAGTGYGGMLVFSEEAKQEAERLSEDGIQVKPFMPEAEDLSAFSAMDGAILMDTEGYCHALGVILDGPACNGADSSRGARYNSALRYHAKNEEKKLLLVVLSDDGMLDLIPEPFPKDQGPGHA